VKRLNARRKGLNIPSQAQTEIERTHSEAIVEELRFWEKTGKDTRLLLLLPLWPSPMPQYFLDEWQYLRARLLKREDENWAIWTNWYEARLAGSGSVSEATEVARVSLVEDEWGQGAAFANARLVQLCL
jgi:hypothetical protein